MTMADEFLAHGCALKFGDENYGKISENFVRTRLRIIDTLKVPEMQKIAERFVFERTPFEIVNRLTELSKGTLTNDLIYEGCHLPATPTWLEMPVKFEDGQGYGKCGFMLDVDERTNVIVCAVVLDSPLMRAKKHSPCVVGTLRIPKLPFVKPYCFDVLKWHREGEEGYDDAEVYVRDLADALFLLQMPRVTETREVTHHPKKQRARQKAGKFPLVDYQIVRFNLHVPDIRYSSANRGVAKSYGAATRAEGGDGGETRRFHRVLEHVRVYREGREKPHVSLIPEHWKGDPSKGIIIKERRIK